MSERVVSLAPSATDILHRIGAGGKLTGTVATYGGWLTPTIDAIADDDPDLVITTDPLQRPIVNQLEQADLPVAHFEPRTLDDLFPYITEVSDLVGMATAGHALVAALFDRLESVDARVSDRSSPIVYCEEWQTPPMVAGNWIPEAIEWAGGSYPFLDRGERSRAVTQSTVEAVDPDHIILHICGSPEPDPQATLASRGWDLTALHDGRITVIDDSLLNQPGPQLISGIERIASVLHPTTTSDAPPQ